LLSTLDNLARKGRDGIAQLVKAREVVEAALAHVEVVDVLLAVDAGIVHGLVRGLEGREVVRVVGGQGGVVGQELAVGHAVGVLGVGGGAVTARHGADRVGDAGKKAIGNGDARGATRAVGASRAVAAEGCSSRATETGLAGHTLVRAAGLDAREGNPGELGIGVAIKAATVADVELPGDVVRADDGDGEGLVEADDGRLDKAKGNGDCFLFIDRSIDRER